MTRRVTFTLIVVILVFVVLGFVLPAASHFLLTGKLFPIYRIENLNAPVAVRGWDEAGLFLVDGRHVQVPGFSRLPTQSAALAEATSQGIEITTDGRVYGLVRVHRWCGNDPVRKHIARVDLSQMLTYVREGERTVPVADTEMLASQVGGKFSQHGWRVGDYFSFVTFCRWLEAERDPGRDAMEAPTVALDDYSAEPDACRRAHGGAHELPKVDFFLLGMGARQKLLYRRGVLTEAMTGREIKRWQTRREIIVPPDYSVYLETTDGTRVQLDYREEHVLGRDAEDRGDYPYLGWACDHFHGTKRSPLSDRDYPLTWEAKASQALYEGLRAIDPAFVEKKVAAPHTWHAAEAFLLLLTEQGPITR